MVRVAQVLAAVGVRQLHRLGHDVHGVRAAVAHLLQGEVLEDVQHLDDVHPARAGRGHGRDVVAPEGAAHRLALDDAVVGQVLHRDQAVVPRHVGGDAARDLAPVEGVGAALGDLLQRPGQIRLPVEVTHLVVGAVGLVELGPRRGVRAEPRLASSEVHGQVFPDDHAVARQVDGRLGHLPPAHGAVVAQQVIEAGHRRGNRR